MSTRAQRRIAKNFGLKNVWTIHRAAKATGLPFEVACALIQKESGGRNVYGHDEGGALSGYPYAVTEENFKVFRWMINNGHTSNGVGPCQITYRGFFTQMDQQGLRPWVIYDNMVFGFRLLKSYYTREGGWTEAGKRYNGALEYGVDLNSKINQWKQRFKSA
jgi:hypothetical protein